ncbi:MAG: penicillin-binding protein 2 [Candidatus Margulisiibacteriota bacterium]|jgi:cell division protein FtsI/penicillin-binding protein 2
MIDLNKEGQKRLTFFLFLVTILFLVLIGRLFWLQIVQYNFLQEKARSQQQRTITLGAKRGNIYDGKGDLLVTSVRTQSLYAIPRIIKNKQEIAHKLSGIIAVPPERIMELINNQQYFVWLKRKLSPEQVAQVDALKEPGLKYIPEEKRIYLYDNLASQLIGFTNLDNEGMSGVEYLFNKHLKGQPGTFVMQSDLFGREIFSYSRKIDEPVDGKKLALTIHSFLQYVSERELKKAVETFHAKGGCVIIADPNSGDILAMASYPDYNPNLYFKYPDKTRNNQTIEFTYEPGSTFKPIVIASAINEKVVDPDTEFIVPAAINIGGRVINDSHKHATERMTVTKILAMSSNIGTGMVMKVLGKHRFYRYLKDFGFGQKTGINFPGESAGIIKSERSTTITDFAIMAFGQVNAVTPLQLVMATSAIANGGLLYKPKIIKSLESEDGMYLNTTPTTLVRRVISEQTSKTMREMMIKVTTEGTGTSAKVHGFEIAGKTGTAQKPAPGGGYLSNAYVGSFIGFAPADKPKFVILVVIDSPAMGVHHGGTCAAPAFKAIAEESIRYLSVAPK